jgi:hypothetical protein
MAVTKMTAPNGVAVSVNSARVESLLRRGFIQDGGDKPTAKKAPAKKAASKKSDSSDN